MQEPNGDRRNPIHNSGYDQLAAIGFNAEKHSKVILSPMDSKAKKRYVPWGWGGGGGGVRSKRACVYKRDRQTDSRTLCLSVRAYT